MDLVPIKVKIGLRANGHADHPDWELLPLARSSSVKSHMPHGWVYDKSCGHQESGPGSPLGMQWGALLVSADFAEQAKSQFPALITELTEAEFETFYNEKSRAHMPTERIDTDRLVGLKAQRDLLIAIEQSTTAIDAEILKALDPDDDTPGVKRQKGKTWGGAHGEKAHKGIDIAERQLMEPE